MSINRATNRVSDWWNGQSSNQRSQLIKTFMVVGVISVIIGFYYLKPNSTKDKVAVEKTSRPVIEPEDFLDRDMDARIEARVAEEVKRALANATAKPVTSEAKTEPPEYAPTTEASDEADLDDLSFNGSPGGEQNSYSYPDAPYIDPAQQNMPRVEPGFIGSTATATNPNYKPQSIQVEAPNTTVLIPPGFMPAKMLVGVMAQVANGGRSDPKPIHLRVQAPATLPNKIKMNLAGCFVIANTWGHLASERIEGETVSLTCMTSDRKTIVEGELTGYLADSDGQRDISGRVVTKAGALLGRSFVAEFLAGSGNAIAQNTGNVAISPLGSVTSMTGTEVAKRGVASGVAGGFNAAAEFLSELLAQSGPVIESGAARDVMIMVQKTSTLKITTIDNQTQI